MEMSDQVIKVIDELSNRFGMAIDWTNANIVPMIERLGERVINYEIATSWVWIVIATLLLITGILLIYFDIKDWGIDLAIITGAIMVFVAIIVLIVQVFDIATCYTMPEKMWLEYIKEYSPFIK